MNTKDNARSRTTKDAIKSNFLSLLEDKEIARITVQELCRISGINRSTFYAHFQDVYDLFDQIEKEMAEHVSGIFFNPDTGELQSFTTDGFKQLLTYIYDNRSFYRVFYNGAGKANVINLHVTEYGRRLIETNLPDEVNSRILEYRLACACAGINEMIRIWLNAGCEESPAEMAEILVTFSHLPVED